MKIQTNSKNGLQKIGSYLFNFGALAGIATLTFGLISCGGGGGGGGSTSGSGSTTPTITSILSGSSYGVVASSVTRALTIYGTNFTNGMNLSIAASSGVTAGTIFASSVRSTTELAVSAVISTAPSDNYVVFAIKSSSGTTTLTSKVLGVAGGTTKTLTQIQAIFSSPGPGPGCTTCHNMTDPSVGNLNLTDTNALFASGYLCNDRVRVSPGDPRRASSLIIDKLKAASSPAACSGGNAMPPAGYSISALQIQDIVDWVAAGAHTLAQY